MKLRVIAALASGACVTSSQRAYPVDAIAQLEPLDAESPRVEGPIELLGTGMPGDLARSGLRTFAAYRVELPENLTVWIELDSATSCADREPLTAPDDPLAGQLLGWIRRVGDETHFFTPSVPVDGYVVDVDTETAVAYASPSARFPRIMLAVSRDDFHVLACGVLTWR